MAETAVLSELCSICYTDKPKYRCPRCKTQTCSLPCYKRHQQRASCNGKRDPAEYLKKSQLATPVGIDRDYNYLKDVERTIDHASRDTADRGIGGSRAVSKYIYRATNPEGKVQKYLEANRITVTRAPRGMSRQKANNTRNTKRDNIMWTVEWVHSGGEKDIRHDCLAESSLNELYSLIQTEKKNAQRKLAREEEVPVPVVGKKRKRMTSTTESEAKNDSRASPSADGDFTSRGVGAKDAETATTDSACDNAKNEDAGYETQDKSQTQQPDSASPNPFFYLLKPGTTSTSKVLIPLTPTRTLTQCLQDQTILEFPTLYILPHAPGDLPPDFTTETIYKVLHKSEEEELTTALQTASSKGVLSSARQPQRQAEQNAASMDANRILDMLKRDVTR